MNHLVNLDADAPRAQWPLVAQGHGMKVHWNGSNRLVCWDAAGRFVQEPAYGRSLSPLEAQRLGAQLIEVMQDRVLP